MPSPDTSQVSFLRAADTQSLPTDELLHRSWMSLFNTASFFEFHSSHSNDFLSTLHSSNIPIARSTFFLGNDHEYVSPKSATYGGFEFHPDTPPADIGLFIDANHEHLLSLGARSVSIRLSPQFPSDDYANPYIYSKLSSIGYTLTFHDLSQYIPISTSDFKHICNRASRRKIQRLLDTGFASEQLHSDSLHEVYSLIADNRKSKGYPISLTLHQLEQQFYKYIDFYKLFGVRSISTNELVAAAICIVTKPSTLYVFYWGELPSFTHASPVSLLASEIYCYCQNNNYSMLDLGRSTVQGEANYGLLRFKSSLGATTVIQSTYKWFSN